MKIRSGFVSNSSSTSFCIYGTILKDSDVKKLRKLVDDSEGMCDEEIISRVIEKHGLDFHQLDYTYYIGKSWKEIKDSETGAQFKRSIENAIEEITGEHKKCTTHEEVSFS
jgi:hypothetical protein